jgi:hypothetical protein
MSPLRDPSKGRDPASGRSGGGEPTDPKGSILPLSGLQEIPWSGSEAPGFHIDFPPLDRPEVESLPFFVAM